MSLKIKLMLSISIPFIILASLLFITTFYGVNHLFSSSNILKGHSLTLSPVNIQSGSSELLEFHKMAVVKLETTTNNFWKLFSIFVLVFVIAELVIIYKSLNNFLNPLKLLEHDLSSININAPKPLNTEIEGKSKEIISLEKSFDNLLSKLKKSFDKQGQFVNNAAHEIKTPLTIIKTSLQLLELSEEPKLKEYKETFKIVQNSSHKLENLIEKLLFLAMNNQIKKKEEIVIKKAIIQSINELHINYPNIDVELLFSSDLTVVADPEMFTNVIDNLLRNSAKYGSNNITVEVHKEEMLNISIKDNGFGIPRDKLPFVKDPFYKCEEARSSTEGYGLGLAIVDEMMYQHGGSFCIRSVEKKGTTVTVSFPLIDKFS